jgi:hypothetical protein
LKQGLIKLGQSRQVVGTNVHVVKLEFHSAFFQLGCFFTFKRSFKGPPASVFWELLLSSRSKINQFIYEVNNLPMIFNKCYP